MKAVQRRVRLQTSDLYSYVKSCEGKRQYASKNKALASLRKLEKLKVRNVKGLQAYKCRFCKHWHLGH